MYGARENKKVKQWQAQDKIYVFEHTKSVPVYVANLLLRGSFFGSLTGKRGREMYVFVYAILDRLESGVGGCGPKGKGGRARARKPCKVEWGTNWPVCSRVLTNKATHVRQI